MKYTHTHTHSHTPNCQSNAEKENKAGGITLSGFKIYYKTIVIKTVWYWHKIKHTDLWNRIGRPKINSHTYGQLIHNKGLKNIQQGIDSLFNKCFGGNWTAM